MVSIAFCPHLGLDSESKVRIYQIKGTRYSSTQDMEVYVYVWSSHIAEYVDQPGKVANPARGQLNRKNEYSPVPVRA